MNLNKIFGYFLILLGLIIILWTLYSSYKIFTGQAPVPQIFFVSSKNNFSENDSSDLQKQVEKTIKEQISEVLPPNLLPQIMNLLSWSILAGILIFGAGHIAGIGIRLIKA